MGEQPMTTSDDRARTMQATKMLTDVFSDGEGVFGRFSCTEIEKLAIAMALLGENGIAIGMILGHAQDIATDEDEDDTHWHLVDPDTADLLPGAEGRVRMHLIQLLAGTRQPGEFWPGVDDELRKD